MSGQPTRRREQPQTEEGFLEGPFPLRKFLCFLFYRRTLFQTLGDQVCFEGGGVRDVRNALGSRLFLEFKVVQGKQTYVQECDDFT